LTMTITGPVCSSLIINLLYQVSYSQHGSPV
jgi:hypothetical protein